MLQRTQGCKYRRLEKASVSVITCSIERMLIFLLATGLKKKWRRHMKENNFFKRLTKEEEE